MMDLFDRALPAQPAAGHAGGPDAAQQSVLSAVTRAGADRATVYLAGELDLHTCPALRNRLTELLEHGHRHLVLDLDQVTTLDPAALSVLIATAQRARARGGTLRLVCTSQQITRVFRATNLTQLLPIHPNLTAALAASPPAAAQMSYA